jgi:hypothetical protein
LDGKSHDLKLGIRKISTKKESKNRLTGPRKKVSLRQIRQFKIRMPGHTQAIIEQAEP